MTNPLHTWFALLLVVAQLLWPSPARSQDLADAIEPPPASISPGEHASSPPGEYLAGPQDVLDITVFGESEVSGKFPIESDGTFNFPLIGRMQGAGLTVRAIERGLQERLADGYLQNPQVSVVVGEFRSQRVFIVGEVGRPGAYPLTARMTLIEALATAGSTSGDAAGQVAVIRGSGVRTAEEAGADLRGAEVLHIDVGVLQAGSLVENVYLRDGDVVVVPRAQSVYVLGQVRSPGAYAVEKDGTVMQALALAGGVTDRGSMSRIRIMRAVNGKKSEIKANVDDPVRAGDIVMVLNRFF